MDTEYQYGDSGPMKLSSKQEMFQFVDGTCAGLTEHAVPRKQIESRLAGNWCFRAADREELFGYYACTGPAGKL